MADKINVILYRELFFEGYLKEVFDRIFYENFELNNPRIREKDIERTTEHGIESGITARYIRRLKPKKEDFNDYDGIIEKVKFFKDNNYSIFVKGQYGLKVRFYNETSDIIRQNIRDMNKEFNKISKRDIGLSIKISGDEAKIEFDRSTDIRDEIYLAYKSLFNYLLSKGL